MREISPGDIMYSLMVIMVVYLKAAKKVYLKSSHLKKKCFLIMLETEVD